MDSTEFEETIDMLDELTEEELNELNDAFDPENNLLPIHERINYDCRKEPSRFFNKNQLSEHLKEKLNFGDIRPVTHPKSMAEKIKEAESKLYSDYVPFVKVEKDYSNHKLELPTLKSVPKARTPSPLPDLNEEEIQAIENATEDELVEVAAQLKMNDLVTSEQIESINRGDKPLGTGILRPTLVRTQYPQKSFSIDEDDEEEDYIDVDGMVKALRSKGEDISIIVCNNQPYMDPEVLEEIAAHLQANKNIRHLSLVNCNFTDSVVESFAEALESNTKLETLNLESNFITPIGIKKILDAIQDSKTLREIRLENQYSKIGPKCEAEMAAAVEKNYTLLSFGYSFETRGPRDAMNRYILRNNDILRAARRNGEACYNLAEQKRIIAKFKPPWILRRPKRRGPDTFEGRKIVMRGDSKKKKKKKGPAMMNEMLAKAAQVSKRYEEKERAGELHSEFKRIEDKSKAKAEQGQQQQLQDELKSSIGRRRNRDTGEKDEESIVENGEVERRRRGRGAPSNEAEGMGAMTRRRRGRGGDDDEEGNDTAENNKASGNEDKADGRQGRGKMDAETRRRAMRGGKIVEDDKTPIGAAVRRRREKVDEDEEGIDFSQFEKKPEEENDTEDGSKSVNGDAEGKMRMPTGKKLAGQDVASLDNASLRGRRRNKNADDEGEDLDAMLSGIGGGDDVKSSRQGREGKAMGSQPVERMETASLRGRRRRKIPDEDEGASLDDMLKTVDSKPVEQEDRNEDDDSAKGNEKEAGSRRESVTKLPTGRQVRQQAEEDIDSILSQAPSTQPEKEKDENNSEKTEQSSKARVPSGRAITKTEAAPMESLSFAERRRRRKQNEDQEEPETNKEETITNGFVEDIAADRERRRRRPKDDDDDEDLDKKREMRRKQREASNVKEEKASDRSVPVEKPAPVEEKKPEPKPEPPVIKMPEQPAVDLSRPMTLRERRRLKEQGLL